MDIVTHAGAIRCRVVIPVDPRRTPLENRADGEREQIVGAAVVQIRITRSDHIEVPQRRVGQSRGHRLVADQPFGNELGLAVRGGREQRGGLGDEVDIGNPVDRRTGREDAQPHLRVLHRRQQNPRPLHVLFVGVQGTRH